MLPTLWELLSEEEERKERVSEVCASEIVGVSTGGEGLAWWSVYVAKCVLGTASPGGSTHGRGSPRPLSGLARYNLFLTYPTPAAFHLNRVRPPLQAPFPPLQAPFPPSAPPPLLPLPLPFSLLISSW